MGVRGIARDLAAAGLGTLKPLAVPKIEGSFDYPVEIRIEDPEGCPAFYGRTIRGLTNGASPDWMQQRLQAAGQRPISALVDITNYVMLDLGRPSHAYDLKEIKGAITARRAKDGEKVLALNEKEYVLDGAMTRDRRRRPGPRHRRDHGRRAFGRQRDDHRHACSRSPISPRNGSRGPGRSSADQRRADPLRARRRPGLPRRRAGAPDRTDPRHLRRRSRAAWSAPASRRSSRSDDPLRSAARRCAGRARRSRRAAAGHPRALGFTHRGQRARSCRAGGATSKARPTWSRKSRGSSAMTRSPRRRCRARRASPDRPPRASQLIERKVRRAAAARGLDEAVNWSFIADAEAAPFGGARHVLANPISEDMKLMRPSLLPGPGRRRPAQRRPRRGQRPPVRNRPALSGRGRAADGRDHPHRRAQPARLAGGQGAGLRSVRRQGRSAGAARGSGRAGRQPATVHGCRAKLASGPIGDAGPWAKTILAAFGELHPRLAKALDAPAGTVAAEIYLDAIPAPRSSGRARPAFTPPALQAGDPRFRLHRPG